MATQRAGGEADGGSIDRDLPGYIHFSSRSPSAHLAGASGRAVNVRRQAVDHVQCQKLRRDGAMTKSSLGPRLVPAAKVKCHHSRP